MRFLLWAAIPAILWGQSGAPLEGTVIDSVTHTPLAGVGVTVVSTSAQHHATYVTATDADGTFRIGNIDQDGEFKADFEKRGFLSVSRNPVRLSAATGPVRLYVELVPHPQLRGRVVDPDGHPVSEARVQLLGVRGNWAINTPVSKDGTFAVRNSLPSAAFLVRAEPGPKLPPPESAEDEPRVWAPTYYPSGTDQSQAVRVVWRGDADLDGYEIRLRAVPVFHVRGTVLDERGKPAAGVAVKLLPADGIDAAMQLHETSEAQTVSANDGTFEIPSVRPGDWRLSVEWKRGGQMLSGFAAGRVSRGDWERADVHLDVLFTMRGVAEWPDGSPRATGMILLQPANSSMGRGVSYNQEGRFEIRDIQPGRYRIVPAGLPTGQTALYVESVRLGEREVLGQTVDLAEGSPPIRVIYKANGGRVQGSAEHCKVVVVFPRDPSLRNGQLIRTGRCENNGRFDVVGLRPGDYYAVAVGMPEYAPLEQVLDELAFDPASIVAQVAASGESVRVEAGQSTTVTPKVVPWPEQ